jgi:hypothetical protein
MDTTPEATNDTDRPLYDAGQANDAITTTAYTVPVRQAAELFNLDYSLGIPVRRGTGSDGRR